MHLILESKMKERGVGVNVEKQTVIVHGVERKGCVADKDGLRKDVMEKLVGEIDMNAQRDQLLVSIFADYLRSLLFHSLFLTTQASSEARLEKFNVNGIRLNPLCYV